jgi:hypothetical protein
MSRNDGEQRSRRQHSRREVSLADLLYAKPGRHAVPTVHSVPKQVVPPGVVGTIQVPQRNVGRDITRLQSTPCDV